MYIEAINRLYKRNTKYKERWTLVALHWPLSSNCIDAERKAAAQAAEGSSLEVPHWNPLAETNQIV